MSDHAHRLAEELLRSDRIRLKKGKWGDSERDFSKFPFISPFIRLRWIPFGLSGDFFG